jgi:hypothetical protein
MSSLQGSTVTPMDSREHRRVRMRLPARLRWTTPFGQKIELVETIDVSRRGVLVSASEPHTPGVPLWVTFPYDSSLREGQPEMSARIVRCDERLEPIRAANGPGNVQKESASVEQYYAKTYPTNRALAVCDASATFAVAIQFEEHAHSFSNGNGHLHEPERRGGQRRALAVPVRVRPQMIPWFEEAMTIDFSATGLRFRSHREYAPGDYLGVVFKESTPSLWHGTGEFRSQVVRVVPAPDDFALDVSVRLVK